MNIEDDFGRLRITNEKDIPKPILDGISGRINALRGILDSVGFETYNKEKFSSQIYIKPFSSETHLTHDDATLSDDAEDKTYVSNLLQIVLELH